MSKTKFLECFDAPIFGDSLDSYVSKVCTIIITYAVIHVNLSLKYFKHKF
jgi:hypothetical protein